MTESLGGFAEVGVAQTLQWLQAEHGVAGELRGLDVRDDIGIARLALSGRTAALVVIPLFHTDEETAAAGEALAGRLPGEDGLVLWTPPGAAVPGPDAPAGDDAADVPGRIRAAAAGVGRGGRGQVGFPVRLAVRRVGEEGSYLSVQGGLSPHWARFTNQVFGQFQLDSSAIHRLPEDAAAVTQLVDFIVLVANGIRRDGKTADVPAEDTWTLQRLSGLSGARVIAATPDSQPEQGTPVRKALRAGTRAALQAFEEMGAAEGPDATLRLLTYVGVFRSMGEETASIALRGLDPAALSQFDAVCLAADGQLRPLLGPTPESGLV